MKTFAELLDGATYFAMSDIGATNGLVTIPMAQAEVLNKNDMGIFWTLNEFKGNVRRKENLIRINCWGIDIDEKPKEEQMELIMDAPLLPSMVVETKRGYQCYWFAKDACVENYSAVVEHRLIPFFGADIRAKDVCRILRVPGYWHCKDPQNKFMCKLVEASNDCFSENEMLSFFKPVIKDVKQPNTEMRKANPNGFWEKAANHPVQNLLSELSGHPDLRGDRFSTEPNTNGTLQIVVNGKKTSSWIDKDGLIGSYDRGGPTISQWVNWYTGDYSKTYRILQEVMK